MTSLIHVHGVTSNWYWFPSRSSRSFHLNSSSSCKLTPFHITMSENLYQSSFISPINIVFEKFEKHWESFSSPAFAFQSSEPWKTSIESLSMWTCTPHPPNLASVMYPLEEFSLNLISSNELTSVDFSNQKGTPNWISGPRENANSFEKASLLVSLYLLLPNVSFSLEDVHSLSHSSRTSIKDASVIPIHPFVTNHNKYFASVIDA